VVRLNAHITADFMVGNDSGNGYRNAAGVAAKQQPHYFGEFYPGFDGLVAEWREIRRLVGGPAEQRRVSTMLPPTMLARR
jgi:hypothetical protein